MESPATQQSTTLILGDADFSFTHDLCQFLAHSRSHGASPPHHIVVASGFDDYDAASKKYSGLHSTIKKIGDLCANKTHSKKRKLGQPADSSSSNVACRVFHSIDALAHPSNWPIPPSPSPHPSSMSYDRIIFNHPHLGTEDLHAHRRFLCHLFHNLRHSSLMHPLPPPSPSSSVSSPYTLVHLTFFGHGQASRWLAVRLALEIGDLQVVDRRPFVPPPAPPSMSSQYVVPRRGASGKAFVHNVRRAALPFPASGGGGGGGGGDKPWLSECLTFARRADLPEEECRPTLALDAESPTADRFAPPWSLPSPVFKAAESGGGGAAAAAAAAAAVVVAAVDQLSCPSCG